VARTRAHIIETESRRIVAAAMPATSWVERDQTERDYGIDLTLEHFAEDEPSGRILLLQIKGTDGPAPEAEATTIPFDLEVRGLRRVERFAAPILLVWVPVNDPSKRAWFLWLQSYIRIVLNHETPDWRTQTTIRVHIPVANEFGPLNEGKLAHIAGEPERAAAFGQLSRLAHAARWAMDDPRELALILAEALELEAIFGDPTWVWGQDQRGMIEKGLLACNLAIAGLDPTDEDLRAIGWFLESAPDPDDWEHRWDLLAQGAQHCARLMSTAVALYFDDRLRHTVWRSIDDHDF
jgi:hypothetical protein